MTMRVVAVILAAGSGQRFGDGLPKQFVKLAGREVVEHTVDVFQQSGVVTDVVVVTQPRYVEHVWNLAQRNRWTKLSRVIVGGADRFGSTHSAIAALSDLPEDTRLLFHDAVRPLVSEEIVERCLVALDEFEAVDVVIASSDTLVEVFDNGCIADIPPRVRMRRGQTPQAFKLKAIRDAYDRALAAGRRDFTCDCGVVRAMMPSLAVATVEGAESNIKVTHLLDLFLAEKLIQSRSTRVSKDSKGLEELKGKRIVVFGGTSGIGLAIREKAVVCGADVLVASRGGNGVDVSCLDSVRRYLDQISAGGKLIDIVINTAGVLIKKPIAVMSADEVGSVIGTNYLGCVNVAIASEPYLEKSSGMLINFTSSAYTRGRENYALYSSSKSAVVNLTQALADEWRSSNIRVNCISPDRTRTPMRLRNFGVEPDGSLLSPDEVALQTLHVSLSATTGMVIDVARRS